MWLSDKSISIDYKMLPMHVCMYVCMYVCSYNCTYCDN